VIDPDTVGPPASELPGGPLHTLPIVTSLNAHFWHGGADGELCFLRCQDCGRYVHPPRPVCPECLSRRLAPEAVSGAATLYSFTVNEQAWYTGQQVPYVVALVELPEQAGLRLTTNISRCPIEEVRIGMPLRVVFTPIEDIYLPTFVPAVT
jgi:uncharacterized OB-fold protein